MLMKNFLDFNAGVLFIFSMVSFVAGYIINNRFNHSNPEDFLAPFAQALGHFVNQGFMLLGASLFFIAVLKYFFGSFFD